MEIEGEDASFKRFICSTKKTYLYLPFEVKQKTLLNIEFHAWCYSTTTFTA